MPQTDRDIEIKTREELIAEILNWRTLVRMHRDQRLQNRCWFDDVLLYEALPEGLSGELREIFALPTRKEWEEGCKKYCQAYWENRKIPETK